jgi:hypothetical protein
MLLHELRRHIGELEARLTRLDAYLVEAMQPYDVLCSHQIAESRSRRVFGRFLYFQCSHTVGDIPLDMSAFVV